MSEHTKEPWIYECGDANHLGIIIGRHGGEVVDGEFSEANARRIVACVNACAGLETEIIERNVGNVWKLIRQRDELLAALKEVTECIESQTNGKGGIAIEEALDDANEAIAKAEQS